MALRIMEEDGGWMTANDIALKFPDIENSHGRFMTDFVRRGLVERDGKLYRAKVSRTTKFGRGKRPDSKSQEVLLLFHAVP
jgi:hypothetical protein